MMQQRKRHVGVLVEVDDSWGRSCVRGIADYAESAGTWTLLIDPRDREARIRLPAGWSGDGVIARLSSPAMAEHVRAFGVPTVDTDTIMLKERGIGRVASDDSERASLALEHLLDRGFRRFAWFAPPSRRYHAARGAPFLSAVEAAGFVCAAYRPGYDARKKLDWTEQQGLVEHWLGSLERPTGIFTADAHSGRQLAEICESLGVAVPGDVAILAGDTDELICNISSPPLSSVRLAARHLGYEAAALLDQLMLGQRVPRKATYIRPLGVVSRQSTDLLAIDDEDAAAAIRFIRVNAPEGISVSDILRHVPVSRRSLEQKFDKHLGRSPAEEIRRVRLEKARDLLLRSDLSIKQVAAASGFQTSSRLGVAFRKRFGLTPLAFRKQSFAELSSDTFDAPTDKAVLQKNV